MKRFSLPLILIILAAALTLSACSQEPQPSQKAYNYTPEYHKETVTLSVITDKGGDKAEFKQLIKTLCNDKTADSCTVWPTASRDHAIIYIAEPTNPLRDSATRLLGHECLHAVTGNYHTKL